MKRPSHRLSKDYLDQRNRHTQIISDHLDSIIFEYEGGVTFIDLAKKYQVDLWLLKSMVNKKISHIIDQHRGK